MADKDFALDFYAKMNENTTPIDKGQLIVIAEEFGLKCQFKNLEVRMSGYANGTITKNIVLNNLHGLPDNVGCAVHEIAHHLLGHVKNNEFYRKNKDLCECEAEFVAYVIASKYGYELKSDIYCKQYNFNKIKEQLIDRMSKTNKVIKKIEEVIDKVISSKHCKKVA